MSRFAVLGLVVSALAACSHPSPPPVVPLPAEPTPAPAATPAPTPAPAAPVAADPPAVPAAPAIVDVEVPAATTTVKLVSPGAGKRVVAKVTSTAGATAPLEWHVDFSASQDGKVSPTPTMVFRGTVATAAAAADGVDFKYAVTAVDTTYPAGAAHVPQLEAGLAGVVGMTLSGHVAPTGLGGKMALHHDAAASGGGEVMKLLKLTWIPMWPALPTEAIAPGAKWTATTTFQLADQLKVTETVDYELVSYAKKTWTIKGTSKLVGEDQTIEGAPVTKVAGDGKIEATLVEGQLVPTVTATRSASFSVQATPTQEVTFGLALGVAVSSPKP